MATKETLPVERHLPQIKASLDHHFSAVIQAPPGAGKTTRIPPALLNEPWLENKIILVLEPRRLAAVSCAGHMARLLKERVGRTVGYQIRLEKKISSATRIRVVTEGIFTRMIQNDPELSDIGLVIFDEFHERHLQTDLGLALCLDAQEAFRPDLRILVMSATMEVKDVSRLLADAPVIVSRGKTYPVKTVYLSDARPNKRISSEKRWAGAVFQALEETDGDILMFLPGVGEIRSLFKRIEKHRPKNLVIIPLYGALTPKEQAKAFGAAPDGKRKIILATAIAETSITIPGIRVVIDTGLMRVPRFSPGSGMTRLETIQVSKASADQRRGRAGRIEAGTCYRLWSEYEQSLLQPFSMPEIHSVDLSGLMLELAAWGVKKTEMLAWMDPPKKDRVKQSKDLLHSLGATAPDGMITPHGRQMVKAGIHPRLSHMVMAARKKGHGFLGCRLAACLMEKDFIRFDHEFFDPDIRLRLEIIEAFEKNKKGRSEKFKINRSVLRRIFESETKAAKDFKIKKTKTDMNMAGRLLAHAFPDRIAKKRNNTDFSYQTTAGKGVFFTSANSLCTQDYIVAVHLDGNEKNAKIFLAAPYDAKDLSEDFNSLLKEHQQYSWDEKAGQFRAWDQVKLGRIIIEQKPVKHPDPEQIRHIMADRIRKQGLDLLPWTKKLRLFLFRCRFLVHTGQFASLPDVSDNRLEKTMESWLAPFLDRVTSLSKLSKIDLESAVYSLFSWEQKQIIEKNAPTHIIVPSGSKRPLKYESDAKVLESPVLEVRLQEMFGLTHTPKVAKSTVEVTLHLLSPAGRVVQITKDLKSFWENTYPEVKKDLMGRYPKHFWPDDPLCARPTSRVKPKP